MWFRKRKDAEASYVAKQCGISAEFEVVGDVVHQDDLEMLRTELFGVSTYTIQQLFEKTTLKCSSI